MQATLRDIVIAGITPEADGICSYRLESRDGAPLEAASPGAHIDLHLPGGLVRQYSLCHPPACRDAYLIAVKLEPQSRGGSSWFHSQAQVGTRLQIGAPRSLLQPSPVAKAHILLAGGIGVTPLYSLAQHFLRTGEPFELHYFARSPADVAFASKLKSEAFKAHVHLHLDLAPAGVIARLDGIFAGPAEGSHLYLCGPGAFMDVVRDRAATLWQPDEIHEERFSAAPVAASGPDGFQVVLAKSGKTVSVPAGRSILDVLMAHGHAIEHSCEQGFCGSCITAVLEGEALHHDTFLTDDEIQSGEWIMPCVSRAKHDRLVLDL